MWLLVLLLLCVVFIVVSTVRWSLHPFLALLLAALFYGLGSMQMNPGAVVEAINRGFGDTLGRIGIVILAGAIIGVFLEKSGGAMRLALAALRVTGRRRVPWAMGLLGYVVSIPVFCDAAFVILAPLNRALSRAAGTPVLTGAIALSLGLYATHTMVPPTPGPVAAAGILGADLGRVLLFGAVSAFVAMAAGCVFAGAMARRDTAGSAAAESPLPEAPEPAGNGHPGALRAALPIVVPLVLIFLRSLTVLGDAPLSGWREIIDFLGQPVMALLVGVALAATLTRHPFRDTFSTGGWAGQAMTQAAGIIFITGAGGAFGAVLNASGIDQVVEQLGAGTGAGLWVPFLLAAALKCAQGSSTVAIITTAGMVAPLLELLGLGTPDACALAVVAMGAGSMLVSHANDSYFWVVTQITGLNVQEGYRYQTLGSLVSGLSAMGVVWLLRLLTGS